MAKLTNKQSCELNTALYHAKRALAYLADPAVVGIAVKLDADKTNGSNYTIVNPACSSVHAIQLHDKEIGSDIAGLSFAVRQLEQFLKANGGLA